MSNIVSKLKNLADWQISCNGGNVSEDAQLFLDAIEEIENKKTDENVQFLNPWEMSFIAMALREYAKRDFGRSYVFTLDMAEKFESARSVAIMNASGY